MIQPARRRNAALLLPAALLALSGCVTAELGAKPAKVGRGAPLTALLDGRGTVPLGDPDGTGLFSATVDQEFSRLCYAVMVSGIATPTAAHIHKGAAGTSGPPVVTLQTPTYMQSQSCIQIDAALASDLVANPAAYYVNVHNEEFPGGAIRAQLDKGKGGK